MDYGKEQQEANIFKTQAERESQSFQKNNIA